MRININLSNLVSILLNKVSILVLCLLILFIFFSRTPLGAIRTKLLLEGEVLSVFTSYFNDDVIVQYNDLIEDTENIKSNKEIYTYFVNKNFVNINSIKDIHVYDVEKKFLFYIAKNRLNSEKYNLKENTSNKKINIEDYYFE